MSEETKGEKLEQEAAVRDAISKLCRWAIASGKIKVSYIRERDRIYKVDDPERKGFNTRFEQIPDTEVRSFTLKFGKTGDGVNTFEYYNSLLRESGVSPQGFVLTSLSATYEEKIRLREIGEQPIRRFIVVGKGRGGPGDFFEIKNRVMLEGDRFKLVGQVERAEWISKEGFLKKGYVLEKFAGREQTGAFLLGLYKSPITGN